MLNDYQKARNTVFRLLKFRPRSEAEIQERLNRKEFNPDLVHRIIDELKELSLIDDFDFARKWAAYRLNRPYGPQRIRRELQQKGINPEIIAAVINDLNEDYDEFFVALKAAEHRLKNYSNIDTATARRRLFDFLIRRGFKADTAFKVIKELIK